MRHTAKGDRCFACDKPLRNADAVVTEDGRQHPFVGRDCFRRIGAAGPKGYQPPKGGPRLFLFAKDAAASWERNAR